MGTLASANELTERAAHDLLNLALATAVRTRDDLRSHGAAVAVAGLTEDHQIHGECVMNAMSGLYERDRGAHEVIITGLCNRSATRSEDVRTEEAAEQIPERSEPGEVRCEALVVQPFPTEPVVDRTTFAVAQDLIGFSDLLEALLRAGVVLVDVRMILASESAERLLDIALVCIARHAEDVVVVA